MHMDVKQKVIHAFNLGVKNHFIMSVINPVHAKTVARGQIVNVEVRWGPEPVLWRVEKPLPIFTKVPSKREQQDSRLSECLLTEK